MTPNESTPEEEVRRLLAAAAEPVTMPPDVIARLDDVLAGLVADRATSDDTAAATVVDLAARRTSRWPKVLVAAAAVSVLGVGIANVLNQTGSSISADSAKSADSRDLGGAEAAPPQDEGSKSLAPTEADGETVYGLGGLDGGRSPQLRSSSVTVDAQRIADSSLPRSVADATTRSSRQCRLPSTSKGDVQIAVRLDGARATLVFRATEDGRRLAEVFNCDDAASPVLTTTVDAP